MPRNARCVLEGLPYHVTQRGSNRQAVFSSAGDRRTYLSLVQENLADAGIRVLAYCLMTNHVHWVVIPERDDSLATMFRRVHGRYAQAWNARRQRSGQRLDLFGGKPLLQKLGSKAHVVFPECFANGEDCAAADELLII